MVSHAFKDVDSDEDEGLPPPPRTKPSAHQTRTNRVSEKKYDENPNLDEDTPQLYPHSHKASHRTSSTVSEPKKGDAHHLKRRDRHALHPHRATMRSGEEEAHFNPSRDKHNSYQSSLGVRRPIREKDVSSSDRSAYFASQDAVFSGRVEKSQSKQRPRTDMPAARISQRNSFVLQHVFSEDTIEATEMSKATTPRETETTTTRTSTSLESPAMMAHYSTLTSSQKGVRTKLLKKMLDEASTRADKESTFQVTGESDPDKLLGIRTRLFDQYSKEAKTNAGMQSTTAENAKREAVEMVEKEKREAVETSDAMDNPGVQAALKRLEDAAKEAKEEAKEAAKRQQEELKRVTDERNEIQRQANLKDKRHEDDKKREENNKLRLEKAAEAEASRKATEATQAATIVLRERLQNPSPLDLNVPRSSISSVNTTSNANNDVEQSPPTTSGQSLDLDERRKSRGVSDKGVSRPKARRAPRQAPVPAQHKVVESEDSADESDIVVPSRRRPSKKRTASPEPHDLKSQIEEEDAKAKDKKEELSTRGTAKEKNLEIKAKAKYRTDILTENPDASEEEVEQYVSDKLITRWNRRWYDLKYHKRLRTGLKEVREKEKEQDESHAEAVPVTAPDLGDIAHAQSVANGRALLADFADSSDSSDSDEGEDEDEDEDGDPMDLDIALDEALPVSDMEDDDPQPLDHREYKISRVSSEEPSPVVAQGERSVYYYFVRTRPDENATGEVIGVYANAEDANKMAERRIRSKQGQRWDLNFDGQDGLVSGTIYSEDGGVLEEIISIEMVVKSLDGISQTERHELVKSCSPQFVYVITKRTETWPSPERVGYGYPNRVQRLSGTAYDLDTANRMARDIFEEMTEPSRDIPGAHQRWKDMMRSVDNMLAQSKLAGINEDGIDKTGGQGVVMDIDDELFDLTPGVHHFVSVEAAEIEGPLNVPARSIRKAYVSGGRDSVGGR